MMADTASYSPLHGLIRQLRPHIRVRLNRGRFVALGYLAALAVAEALSTRVMPMVAAGLALYGSLLLALCVHSAIARQRRQQRLLLALTLAPLIRLLSLSLPLSSFPFVYWYALVGAPLFLAAGLAARAAGYSLPHLGLRVTWRGLPLQLAVGLSGLGLGYVEYLILRPQPLARSFTWHDLWLPAIVLAVFTGLLEELVFRGLLQRAAVDRLGVRWGIIYVAALFAALHLGYHSAVDIAFVFAAGLFFGWVVQRTGSIVGVTVAHSLTNIMLFLVVPFLIA